MDVAYSPRFRWVELSVDMLSNSRRLSVEKDVRSKLGQLPGTLKQQYEMIYEEILDSEPATASIAKRVFSWILAARRALFIEEFIAAVALEEEGYYHDDLDVSRVLDICRNLIVVVAADDQSSCQSFRVAHLSVKEYLMGLSDFSNEHIHTLVMLRCLQVYDRHLNFNNGVSSGLEGTEDPMLDYSIYLFKHAQLSNLTEPYSSQAICMKAFLFNECGSSTPALRAWISLMTRFLEDSVLSEDTKDYPLYKAVRYEQFPDNGVYIACRYGLLSVLETLEDNVEYPWKVYTSRYEFTPLYAATSNGKRTVARWLLEKGLSSADEVHGHVPPLYSAVRDGDVEVVDLLLRHGADPLSGGNKCYSNTPWHMVFCSHDLDVFRSLLNTIQYNYKTEPEKYSALTFDWKNEALFEALLESWTTVVPTLIGSGANVFFKTSRQDEFVPEHLRHSTTLQVAVEYSEVTTIQMLLEAASKSSYESFKSVASTTVSRMYTRVNSLDPRGCSALHYLMKRSPAISREAESIISILLASHVDPRITSNAGITALHVVGSNTNHVINQPLLRKLIHTSTH